MTPIKLPREQKQVLVERLQAFFELERSETIGSIAAEQLLDYMLSELGPYAYNQAVQDARRTVLERVQALEDELYSLEKRTKN